MGGIAVRLTLHCGYDETMADTVTALGGVKLMVEQMKKLTTIPAEVTSYELMVEEVRIASK